MERCGSSDGKITGFVRVCVYIKLKVFDTI